MEEFIQQTPAKHHPAFSPGLEAELRNLDAAPAKELACERKADPGDPLWR